MSRPSDRRKLAVWRERFERFSRSGLAVVRFCAREGVSTASFYTWRKRLRLKGRRRSAREDRPLATEHRPLATQRRRRVRSDIAAGRARFQQVAVVPTAARMLPTAPTIRIELPCGTRIEVGAEDIDALRVVIAEVARADGGREAGTTSVARADGSRGAGGASAARVGDDREAYGGQDRETCVGRQQEDSIASC